MKVEPPADRRGAQMKDPSERAPRGKYAGGVLENKVGELSFLMPHYVDSFGFADLPDFVRQRQEMAGN